MKSFLLVIMTLVPFLGCAAKEIPNSEITDLKRQIMELQKVQGAQSSQLDELGNKISVITDRTETKAKGESQNQPPMPSAGMSVDVKPAPQNEIGHSALPLVSRNDSGADRLYSQAIQAANNGQVSTLQKDVELLLKGYRESPLSGNALFLLGETLYGKGQFLKAAEQFEKLYKGFPDGNKAVSALYQLGLCYKKLGKPNEAQEAFENVVSVYPGSKEALLAKHEVESGESSE